MNVILYDQTIYEGRPNSPEFMPLDNSLNADLKLSHDRHCVLTRRLPKNDPRKFSMSTPKLISCLPKQRGDSSGIG